MDSRTFMRKGEKITLFEETSGNKKTFSIISKDGAGSSSVSYIASCGRKTGRLKEFYPSEIIFDDSLKIVRNKDNQLSCSAQNHDVIDTYNMMLKEYLESYHMLDDAKKDAKKGNNSFATFIPTFEIYRGYNKGSIEGGSVYIWTMDNNGDFETFDRFIQNVHKHPTRNPAKILYTILKALYNLTECTKTLHTAGLIHSDIKPENFGFFIRDGRYLTEQVQLFDVNSIYSVYTNFPNFTGTPGFCAPEVFKGKITNQSDLYSIGAVLFNAVVLNDDIPDSLYVDEYYNRIDEIIANSKLLNASPVTSSAKFQAAISKILKECLSKELRKRIDNCDELKESIKRACALLIPAQYNDVLDLGSELKIIDKELEQFDDADSIFAIQSLLFNHPLYENTDDTIKVLIAGFGVYGQLFLDQCLQAGQVKGKKLEVTILTHDKEVYKKEYLDKRPALINFFEIDGIGDLTETNYGKLVFINPEQAFDSQKEAKKFISGFSKTNNRYNKEFAQELMLSKSDSSYVFIALGEDKLNLSVARACGEVASEFELSSTIAYVCSNNKKHKGIIPVNMTARARENMNYEEIERMAFNAHLSWNSPLKLNINVKKARRDFLDKYNHDASVACVLAIKNSLYACGIELRDFSKTSIDRAAKEFTSYIKNNKDVFIELVYIEHKRWVIEKITNSWTCRTDLTPCLYEAVNDKRKKLHPCILKSKPDFNLEKNFKNNATGKWYKSKWNIPCEEDGTLDDLDMLSVKLHRLFYNAAQDVRNTYSPESEEVQRIRWTINEYKDSTIAFNEWILCLKRIWKADESQTKFYDGYKDAFLQTISSLAKSKRDEIAAYVKIIDSKARPIIKAYEMRDYKSSDKDLINAIPFILTHKEDYSIFVPLMSGNNTERFNNVSSATLINPENITYGVYIKTVDDIKAVSETVKHILSYMDKKDIKSKLRFVFLYREKEKKIAQVIDRLVDNIKAMDSRIKKVTSVVVSCEAEIATVLSENVSADIYEQNTAYLSALLMGAGFYQNKANYSFDSSSKQFTTNESCEWLNYIKSGQFITVSDMISFKSSTGVMESLPEYTEFKKLWGIYKKTSYAWKDMCKILEQYSNTSDLIASFNISTDLSNPKMYEFVVPNELRASFSYIISYLRDKASIISSDSTVEYNTIESCRVVIGVGVNNIVAIKNLFSNPYMLMSLRDISIRTKSKKIEVLFNASVVSGLKMMDYPEFSDKKKAIGEILQTLQNEKYIYNLKNIDNQEFSFIYSTRQAKQLMTNAGRILEIYVYHKLQESGFDDVVSGYEIKWENTSVKSECDVIVTSGFKSAIIECKAQDKISQDYYYKLSCIAKQFGINAIPVLIADTHEQPDRDNSVNEMQRERGEMMGVVTIYDRNEISNIDMTLRRILSGKY